MVRADDPAAPLADTEAAPAAGTAEVDRPATGPADLGGTADLAGPADHTADLDDGEPPARFAPPGQARATSLARGASIGRFTVLDTLGKGGMGVVVSAYDHVLDRKVAIKLLRRDRLGGDDDQDRLLREAQTTARLSHPNVVTVFEVGVTGDELYLAMEFLDGGTLRGWLADGPRTRKEIVDQFARAGAGLAAAHQAGLVHRDFKPENVLVGSRGEVRVTDFGVAAIVAGRGRASADADPLLSTVSDTGRVVGTPAYMAPEQHLGEEIDARADQFSFCVALYEALYGERPFAGASIAELRARITTGHLEPAPAGRRVPDWMRRVLVRGLAVAPDQRFPSMEALLAALARDPVAARRRWLWRGGLALALAAGAGAGALLLTRGDHAPSCDAGDARLAGVWDDAARARVHAAFAASGSSRAEETFTRVVQAIDTRLQRWRDGYRDACEATHVRGEQSAALLDLRMICLERARRQLGGLAELWSHGVDDRDVDRAVKAASAAGDIEGCTHVETLAGTRPPPGGAAAPRVEALRARLDRLAALKDAGRYTELAEQAGAALTEARDLGYPPLTAEALHRLGQAEAELGKLDEGIAHMYQGVREAAAGHDDARQARLLRTLLFYAGDRGQGFVEADVLSHLAEAAMARVGDDDLLRADLLDAQGSVLSTKGQYAEALDYLGRSLDLTAKVYGDDHPLVAGTLHNMANASHGLGDYVRARELAERAIAVWEATVGPDHPNTSLTVNLLGIIQLDQGEPDAAAASFERAIALRERIYGADHPMVATARHNLGIVRLNQGRLDEAEALWRDVARIREAKLGPDSTQLASTLGGLAQIAERRGDLAAARAGFERSLAIKEKVLGRDHPSVAYALSGLGAVLVRQGDLAAARDVLARARAITDAKLDADNVQIAPILTAQADLALRRGRPREALPLLTRALEVQEKARGPLSTDLIATLTRLGTVRANLDDLPGARADLERAQAIADARSVAAAELATTHFRLAQVLFAQGERERALDLARRAQGELASDPELAGELARWLRTTPRR